MLEQTFVHIAGIGSETERSLWAQGCDSWQCLLEGGDRFSVGSVDRDHLHEQLRASIRALESRDHGHFRSVLGMKHAWRALPEFKRSCVYLDIETDGRACGDAVTIIGLYDGLNFQCLVKNQNLHEFPDIISQYGMVVTFYGAGFDLPMLLKRFPGIHLDQIHLDLCIALKGLGIKGGLKKIEKQLNIGRSEETDGLSGLDAIRLWKAYVELEDERALDTLIAYNREDVVNLEVLADYAYTNLWNAVRVE